VYGAPTRRQEAAEKDDGRVTRDARPAGRYEECEFGDASIEARGRRASRKKE